MNDGQCEAGAAILIWEGSERKSDTLIVLAVRHFQFHLAQSRK